MFTLKWKFILFGILITILGLQFQQTFDPPCCEPNTVVVRDTVEVLGPVVISEVSVPFEVTREVPGPEVIKEVPVPFEVTREVPVTKLVPVLVDRPSAAHAYVAMQKAVNRKFEGFQVLYDDMERYSIPWTGGRSRTSSSDCSYIITSYIAVTQEGSFCCVDWYLITAQIRFLGGDPNDVSSWNVSYKFEDQ